MMDELSVFVKHGCVLEFPAWRKEEKEGGGERRKMIRRGGDRKEK